MKEEEGASTFLYRIASIYPFIAIHIERKKERKKEGVRILSESLTVHKRRRKRATAVAIWGYFSERDWLN